MKIAIVGSREGINEEEVRLLVSMLPKDTTVVSGGAKGVDSWAENEAINRNLKTEIYYADWKKLGPSAGFQRNTTIAEVSDLVIAFWNGISAGTADTIRKAKNRNTPVIVITEPGEAQKVASKLFSGYSCEGNGGLLVLLCVNEDEA